MWSSAKTKFMFGIITKEREWRFCAASDQVRKAWVDAIQEMAAGYRVERVTLHLLKWRNFHQKRRYLKM